MSKHTKGPWVVEDWDFREPDGCVINSGMQVVAINGSVKNGVKCAIYAATEDGDSEEMEANLHLIAAAPELLDALERLKTEIILSDVDMDYIDSHFGKWIKNAELAIAKAKGAVI